VFSASVGFYVYAAYKNDWFCNDWVDRRRAEDMEREARNNRCIIFYLRICGIYIEISLY
jgi:hypothetical protein